MALGTGALMLGATILGATAATWDLMDYPAPFVADGQLDDTVLVVGAAAQTADVLGAIDIAAALQAAAVSQTAVEVSTAVAPTTEDGLKIEKNGAPFNINDQMTDVQTTDLDDSDLDLLSDGTFDDNEGDNTGETDFTQTLAFGTTSDDTFELMMEQPDDSDVYEDGRPFGTYLHLAKNADVYTYTLLLDSGVDVDNAADMEGNTLDIQGNTYTITDARADTSGTGVDKLTVVAGDSTLWLVQDQPYTIGSHTVTVVDVDSGETKCGVNVDGVTIWIDDGTTEEFGDMSVGVLDVVAVYTKDYDADTCELSLGSYEIVLEDGEKVSINDVDLDGSTVTFTGSSGDWTGFTVNYDAGKEDTGINQDDLYLAAGEAWTDPVFGNWKVEFAGTTGMYEELYFDASGDDAELVFLNNDDEEVTLMWAYDDSTAHFGEATEKPMLQVGESTTQGPEDVYLLYSTDTDEIHVLQIEEIDCTDGITINDVTYDNDAIADEYTYACDGANNSVDLGSLGSVRVGYDNTTLVFGDYPGFGDGEFQTKYEAVLSGLDNETFVLTEYDDSGETPDVGTFAIVYDADDGFQASQPTGILGGGVDVDNDDDSSSFWHTLRGSTVEREEDGYWLRVMHPGEDVFGNVFVLPMDSDVTSGGSDSVMADKVNPFSVGLAVLDSEAGSMSKNMIVVGGPCANTVAAELMGNPENCAEGFEAGKAMLKYFDRSGMAALLVAGDQADDTVGAAYVLADYDSYDLSGDEVEVVVTSLDEITVS